MSSRNRITIVSVCDNHYIILLATLIRSIELNHKTNEVIDYYIVEDHISNRNKKKLSNSVDPRVIQIHWIKISEVIPAGTKLPLDGSSFPLNIYARLWIPYFIPQDVDKVLYLDVDMVVRHEISELWHTEMGDKIIGGVVDRPKNVSNSWGGILNYKELGLDPETKYFNSGLLLINPMKWRESSYTEKVITCVKDNIDYANYPDQYGLNVVFANEWLELDPLWNVHATSDVKNPYLIHFSNIKPIYTSYINNKEYKEEFDKYLKQTAWSSFKAITEFGRKIKKIQIKLEKKILMLFN